jgi:trk system potassium uptake protein
VAKTRAPAEAVGRSLGESQLRRKYQVTVVGIKRSGEGFTYATADTVVRTGDVLIVAGRTAEVERVANLP